MFGTTPPIPTVHFVFGVVSGQTMIKLQIYSRGFKYLRYEKWEITRLNITNTLYGIKILRFKFFVCVV